MAKHKKWQKGKSDPDSYTLSLQKGELRLAKFKQGFFLSYTPNNNQIYPTATALLKQGYVEADGDTNKLINFSSHFEKTPGLPTEIKGLAKLIIRAIEEKDYQ